MEAAFKLTTWMQVSLIRRLFKMQLLKEVAAQLDFFVLLKIIKGATSR
jgi:hypothetical protein